MKTGASRGPGTPDHDPDWSPEELAHRKKFGLDVEHEVPTDEELRSWGIDPEEEARSVEKNQAAVLEMIANWPREESA